MSKLEWKSNQYMSWVCRIGEHHRCQNVRFYGGWPDCECFCHAKNNTNDLIKTKDMDQMSDDQIIAAAAKNNLNEILYGPKSTRWQIFLWKWRMRFERIGGAWLVLTGKAHIE